MTTLETRAVGTHRGQLLRELATLPAEGPVLTMYVNLDSHVHPTLPARTEAARSVIEAASRNAPSARWRELLEELADSVGLSGFGLESAQGMLLTATAAFDTVRVVRLPRPVPSSSSFDSIVHLRELLDGASAVRWAVALVNRRTARILTGTSGALREHVHFRDAVEGRHHQGGWSQKRFERASDKHADDHVRHVADELTWLLQSGDFEHLLVAAPVELRGRIEELMHPYVRDVLAGWISADVDDTSDDAVLERARDAMVCHELRLRDDLVRQVVQNIGRRHRGTHGVDAVLAALNNHQVDALLVSRSLSVNGMSCDRCGWMAPIGERCPIDGEPLRWRRDIIEHAVAAAIRQDADVIPVSEPEHPDDDGRAWAQVEQLGGIAAVLRFDLDEAAETR